MKDVSILIGEFENGYKDSKIVYKSIEQTLYNLGLDIDNYGTDKWNPLSYLIKRGDKVVIKPNLVLHHNENANDIDAVVTHSSILRPLVDYSLKALDGTGELIIADAPHGDAVFESVIEQNGLQELVNEYNRNGNKVKLRDLRRYYYPSGFFTSLREERPGDEEGYTKINMGSYSYLSDVKDLNRLYGSDFNREFIVNQHLDGNHFYMISNTIMNADVVISVPKLKTHKKTGITVNLKNLVGINGNKNFLAHYRIGSPSHGGDEYPNTYNPLLLVYRFFWVLARDGFLKRNTMAGRNYYWKLCYPVMRAIEILFFKLAKKRIIDKGNWYGNDTCWRMCLDLNYILRYADKKGKIQDTIQRKYFCLVDGIISGEGEGPMDPTPKKTGIIVAGLNQYYTDYICASLMGFSSDKIPFLKNVHLGNHLKDIDFNNIEVICRKNGSIIDYKNVNMHFEPQYGWVGHIEK